MHSLTAFSYPVARDGHTWIDAKEAQVMGQPDVKRWLTDGIPCDARWGQQSYHPLENPVLFKTFAYTDPTEQGVKAFADKFGLLGSTSPIVLPDGHRFAGQLAYGEPLPLWHDHIRAMRLTMAIWDALQDRDIDTLRDTLRVQPGGRDVHGEVVGVSIAGHLGFPGDEFPSASFPAEMAGDLAKLALAYVRTTLNKWLENAVSPSMVEAAPDGLRIQWRPLHLVGAMWLQFALAVDSMKQFRPCAACGTWFEVSTEGSRASRQYCSNACRMRSYRSRKAGKPV